MGRLTAVYVYGVVESSGAPRDALSGVGGREVRPVVVGRLAALVSEVDEELELDIPDVMAHASVVEAAFSAGTVLPVRAGTVTNERSLRTHLRRRAREYRARLRQLAGRCELEVTARYEEEPVLREILSQNRELRRLSRAGGPHPDLASQFHLGELVYAELERRKADAELLVSRRLGRIAAAVRLRPPVGEEVFRASCLVEMTAVGTLVAQARAVSRDQPWLSLDVAGPVPPYSFAEPLG